MPLVPAHGLMALLKSERRVAVTKLPFMPCPLHGKRLCLNAPWHTALSRRTILCVSWSLPAPLLDSLHTECNRLRQLLHCELEQKRDFSRPIYKGLLDQSAAIALRTFFPPSAALALGRLVESFELCPMVCVPREDSMSMKTRVALSSQMVFAITVSALGGRFRHELLVLANFCGHVRVRFRHVHDLITQTVCLGIQHGCLIAGCC